MVVLLEMIVEVLDCVDDKVVLELRDDVVVVATLLLGAATFAAPIAL